MKKLNLLLVLIISIFFAVPASAHEGMFIPTELSKVWDFAKLKKIGLNLSAKQIKELMPAVMKIAHGGTGSFVSPKGLLVTNHHVAYGCIAALSAQKTHWGILKKGFYAKNLKNELHCPGYDLMVVDQIEDITAKVKKLLGKKKLSMKKEEKALRVITAKFAQECMKKRALFCDVRAYNGGMSYYLNVYKKITDVRLVYAPPSSLGKFGGDIDNWRYPRHTADFTFLRAYVSKDGKGGTGYSKENIPFKPKKFLKIAKGNNKKGDITMVMGFPGRTNRFFSSHAARFQKELATPVKQKLFEEMRVVLKKSGDKHPLVKARYASLMSGLANASKYYSDSLASMKKYNLVKKKEAQEKALMGKLKDSEKKQVNKTLNKIKKIYDKTRGYYKRFLLLNILAKIAPSVKGAFYIARWNRVKKESSINREYEQLKDKNLYLIKGLLKRIDQMGTRRGEKALILYTLRELKKLNPKDKFLKRIMKMRKNILKKMKKEAKNRGLTLKEYYRFALVEEYNNDPLEQLLDMIFAKTAIFSWSNTKRERKRCVATRMKYFNLKSGKVKKIKDPLLELGYEIDKELHSIEQGEAFDLRITLPMKLRPEIIKNLYKAKYHDANFTLRVSYGINADYTNSVSKKFYPYYTTLKGMVKKYTGKFPFDLPASFLKMAKLYKGGKYYNKSIKGVPLDFTTKLDTTGGNSGSPVLNGNGELIGLLFDGTPESILSDWFYREDQRSICFDIHFAKFLLEEWSKATRIVKELSGK